MKKLFSIILTMLLSISMLFTAAVQTEAASSSKIVVVYFSNTGTTETVAKRISKKTGATMVKVEPTDPYTADDLDWNDDNSRVSKEHDSADSPAESSVRPDISNLNQIKKAVKKADVVFIGYPIWWGEAPHIMYNLVENVDLGGKTVVPFCTSMSSGIGRSDTNLKSKAKINDDTKWEKGKNYHGAPSQKVVNKWLKKIGY